jgi:hypothetical protein
MFTAIMEKTLLMNTISLQVNSLVSFVIHAKRRWGRALTSAQYVSLLPNTQPLLSCEVGTLMC